MNFHLRPGSRWLTPALLFGSAVYLYANLFALPAVPFLLSGDQVYFWMNAQRMLQGERIYLDFFQFTPPGTDLFYFDVFTLFGPRVWVPNAVALVLGVVLCWVCFRVSIPIMEQSQAFLAASLFLVLIYGKLLNATHHWFSVLAVMAAVAILLNANTSRRVVIAGILLGIASFFTQTRGPIAGAGIAVFLIWERFRRGEAWPTLLKRQALLIVSFAATLAILSAYFIATVGIRQLWYFQIAYVRHYMVSGWAIHSLGLPETPTWRRLPAVAQYLFVYALLPVVYAIALWRCWRARRSSPSRDMDRVALLGLVGLAMLMEVVQSVNWLRVYCVAMPGIVLFVWLLGRVRFRACATGFLWTAVLCLAFLQTWVKHHRGYEAVDFPAGRTAIAPQAREKLAWLTQNTKPGQLFFQAAWPGLYLPLELHNPVYLDALETGIQTRPEYIERSIRQLDAKQVRYILWSPRLDFRDPFQPPEAYHLAAFREFLHSRYQLVRTFPDQDEIWERK